jgi:type IV pilus assembly protein PilQ
MPGRIAGKSGATFRALALAALVIGLAAAGPGNRATLTNVALQEIGNATQVSFSADKSVTCESVAVTDPSMIVFDIRGANHSLPHSADLESALMKGMQTDIWHDEEGTPITRVTVFLKSPARHWVESADKGFSVMLAPASETATPSTPVTHSTAEMTAEVSAMAEASAAGMSEAATSEAAGESDTWGEVTVEGTTPAPMTATMTPNAEIAPEDMAPAMESEENSPIRQMLSDRPVEFTPQAFQATDRYADRGSRVSLDVQGADIRTVMRSLAEYSGTNIVVGKEVTGSVTVNLTEVPWIDALNTICRTQSLGWVDEDGILRVETLDNLRKEDVARSSADRQLEDLQPLSTQIVRAVYATATELKPAIEKTLTGRGHVEVDPRTNSLVITDVSKRVSAAVEMVKHLDSRTPQIEITAKLVDVDARYTRDLGINWGLGQIHSSGDAWSGEAQFNNNKVIDPAGSVKFGLVRSWGTINAMLSALEQDSKADIISNPRITTVNNREARILVGRKIPLIVLDEAGNAITQLTTIGITLKVTPHINDDERITLDLHPEVSDLASQATVQGGIIINTSEADTRVIVDDGETAVIGGLIRSNTGKVTRGVPILKSIPVIGSVFRSTSEVKEKRELLIFITPRIITNWAETSAAEPTSSTMKR